MFNKLRKKISWEVFEKELSHTIDRFPLAVAALGVFFLTAIFLVHFGDDNEFLVTFAIKIIITAVFTALLTLSVQFLSESYGWSSKYRTYGHAAVIILGALYFLWLPDVMDNFPLEMIGVHILIHTLLLVGTRFAFFVKQIRDKTYTDEHFYAFNITSLAVFLESAFIGFLVFILGSATLGSIDALFQVSFIEGERYFEWFLFSAILVAPIYFLSKTPGPEMPVLPKESHAEKFLRFIVLYIAIPFICIYFLILYAYTVKVLLDISNWPKGVLSWLVIWFSFFGWAVYTLSYHVKNNHFVQAFRKWYPWILLPQVAMLFYAIVLRIGQHGFTVNRYLVIAFGVWLVCLSVYYIWSKKKHLVFLPASLSLSILIITIGPWSMFSVSERSQLGILQERMERVGVLQDGQITRLADNEIGQISAEDKRSIPSVIRYICAYHGCDQMRSIFGDTYIDADKIGFGRSQYAQASHLIEATGLQEYPTPVNLDANTYLSTFVQNRGVKISVDGYEEMYFFDYFESRPFNVENKPHVEITNFGGQLMFAILEKDIRVEITDQVDNLLQTYGNQRKIRSLTIDQDQLSVEYETDQVRVKMLFTNLSGQVDKSGNIFGHSISGYALVDYK